MILKKTSLTAAIALAMASSASAQPFCLDQLSYLRSFSHEAGAQVIPWDRDLDPKMTQAIKQMLYGQAIPVPVASCRTGTTRRTR